MAGENGRVAGGRGMVAGGREPVVGEVPTKRSSDHDPMIRHCRIIGRFETEKQNCRIIALKFDI